MTEKLNDQSASFVPEFGATPQALRYHNSPIEILGGAVVPFGFSEQYSTPVIDDDAFDFGAAEIRTNHKVNEDTTSGEYLPF